MVRAGDLEFDLFLAARPADAIQAHQRIQQSRPDHYVPEMPISHTCETEAFVLEIGGRIDGVYFYPDAESPQRLVVEEIKTTQQDLAAALEAENAAHWAQLKIYAYLCARQFRLDSVETHLTYCRLDSHATRVLRRTFSTRELEIFFDDIILRYVAWAAMVSAWCEQRDASIRNLPFPFSDYRPGQRAMAVAVYRTIRDGGHLMVEAATGIGKTLAAVYPAVKSLAEGYSHKIFYLTARTTARIVAENTLALLRDKGLHLKAVTLTAKDKICFCPDSPCHPEECEYAKGFYDRLNGALEHSFQEERFTRETVERIARAFTLCPFELSLELCLWSDCIIGDYNYVFDPRVYLRRFFAEPGGGYTFLVDEAHNLVDRAREMFSAAVARESFLAVRRRVRQDLPDVYRRLGKINAALVKMRKTFDATEESRTDDAPPEFLYSSLYDFLATAERRLRRNPRFGCRQELLDLYFEVNRFVRAAERFSKKYATLYDRCQKELQVRLFCLDPAEHLREALDRGKAAVFFSATLTPGSYFQKILGCRGDTGHLSLPSPFPLENLGLFVASDISTYYKSRMRTRFRVAQALDTLISGRSGNYLAFFPSYEYLRMVHEVFVQNHPGVETIVQSPLMSEGERDVFLDRFQEKNRRTLLGFAVMGGVFGEGVDLVGRRLSGAIIVGLGLPGICPERELIRHYFAEHTDSGFAYAYLYPGINRVLQAAGRVIRSESDRGVVLLIDPRFATRRIRSLLPPTWAPVAVKQPVAFQQAVDRFWQDAPALSMQSRVF